MPPLLAGRGDEQAELQAVLADLQAGVAPPRDLVLIGPRGNGKTVLMRWIEAACEREDGVDVEWTTPDEILDLDALARRCAAPARWKELLPHAAELGIGVVNLRWQLDNDPGAFTDLLLARCQRRPLALLLDEAHMLEPRVGLTLLNASQKVRGKAPFLLVLGGTPDLRRRLNKLKATFWNRSRILGVGRLDGAGARAALMEPFRQHGISFEPAALEQVIADSQRYPYFLQCWGAALVNALRSRERSADRRMHSAYNARAIDVSLVTLARAEAAPQRDVYYQDRYTELEERDLLPAATAVAAAFASQRELGNRTLVDALAGKAIDGLVLPPEVKKARYALQDLGYIWQSPGLPTWEPGIPSLMDYVRAATNG